MNAHRFIKFSLLATVFVAPMFAAAESNFASAASGALTATARLDFKIVIPRVLYFAVGNGAAGTATTASPNVDLVAFDYTTNPAAVGQGTVAAVTSGTVVPVRVVGNGGAISVAASTVGALNNGTAADTIPWSEITATSSDASNFPSPAIPGSGAGTASSIAVSSGTKVTNRTANWTYAYANTAVVSAGSYGGAGSPTAGLQNGRVTYTASMP